MASSPSTSGVRRPGRRRLVAALIGLAVALALVEIGLRVAVARDPKVEKWVDPVAFNMDRARIEGHPYLAYALKPSWSTRPGAEHEIHHNSLGFRGPETTWEKPEGVVRILCLGGSSTYGHGPSNDAATWPARLQAHLQEASPERRFEVINGGAQGYSTFESSINLALRGVDLEPDLVVVYHTVNDMRCALYPNPQRDNTHWRAIWPVERPSALRDALEHSLLFRLARTHLTDYDELRSNLGGYVIVDFEPGNKDVYARTTPPETGFRSFERNLRTIVAVAREHGIGVAFVTQGLQREDLGRAPSSAQQLAAFDRMTETLRTLGPAEGVLVIDAGPVLEREARKQLEASGAQSIFTHEVHLQDPGADLLGRTVADGLLGAGAFD